MTSHDENESELRHYRGIVVRNGKQVTPTIYSDWFVDDAAAIAGYKAIMVEQGYNVLSVQIGEIVTVETD